MLLNAAPVAIDDHYVVNEDELLLNLRPDMGVLVNDRDAESDPLTAVLIDDVLHGALTLSADGSFAYAPNVDFHGTDQFTYAARDTQRSNVATVTIEVRSQYDAPIATPDAYWLSRRAPQVVAPGDGVLANDESPDAAALIAVLERDVAEGRLQLEPDGAFRYDAQGFVGTTSFSYRAGDGTGWSDAITVTLTVTDAPVASPDVYQVREDEVLLVQTSEGVLANDSFAPTGSINVIIDQMPQRGALAMQSDGAFAYGAHADFSGHDAFTYHIVHDQQTSNTVTVDIEILPVNDVPIPETDAYLVMTDHGLTVSAQSGVLANDWDLEGDPFVARLLDPPEHGTLDLNEDGSFHYEPAARFSGTDQFTYRAADATAESPPVQVHLTVAAEPLAISELMADNASTLPTRIRADATERFRGDTMAYDWIELRNLLPDPLPIGGMHLTDQEDQPTKWQIPAGTMIPALGYLVIYASGEDIRDPDLDHQDRLHTNFALDAGGEYLAVTAADGTVVFEFSDAFPAQRPDVSYGHGSNDVVGYFVQPTPSAVNVDALVGEVREPQFSIERGLYDQPLSVEIVTPTDGATIRYTRDGTPPTETNGAVYSGPIPIQTTTTLRAVALKTGMIPSAVETHTYLFLDSVVRQSEAPEGYPSRWRTIDADYGMSQNADDLPLIAGDANLSRLEAEARIQDSLRALPTLSIVLPAEDLFDPRNGIYTNPSGRGDRWQRAASVEYILPDGAEGFQIDAGLRIMGGTSRNLTAAPKQSFRLLFQRQYGQGRLEYPFFDGNGVDSYNTLALRANTRDSWTTSGTVVGPREQALYFRDEWAKTAQANMGQLATSGNFVHLYLNGMYWGLYNPTERPDAAFAAEHLGGDDSDYDVVKFCCPDRVVDGDMRSWNELLGAARDGLQSDAAYQRILGNHPDGTRNEDYDVLLDVDNFIDYVINGQYHAAVDWPGNYYVARNHGPGSDGFQFYTWDNDLAFPSLSVRQSKVRTAPGHNWWTESPGEIEIAIRRNAEYRMRFADRAHMHLFHDGALTPDNAAALWSEIADGIETALMAESARWGDYRRDVAPAGGPRVLYTVHQHWRPTVDRMLGDYFPRRTEMVIQQLRTAGLYPEIDAPEYLVDDSVQYGGGVPRGTLLTIQANAGQVYYTLDGADPRLPGGAVNPDAIRYQGAIALSGLTTVKSRVWLDQQWSALSDATFTVATVPAGIDNLRVTEIAYHPHAPIVQFGEVDVDEDQFEFIEFTNVGPQPIDLGGVRLVETVVNDRSQGVSFVFQSQILAPGERLVVAKDVAAFRSRFGDTVRLAHGHDGLGGVDGQYGGRLANGGEQLTLLAADDSVIQQFTYDDSDPWPRRADGGGSSLEVIDPSGDINHPANWRSSHEFGGSPGRQAVGVERRVVINEVFSHPQPPAVDWLELVNPLQTAVDIGGWYISDSRDNPLRFTIPAGTTLAAGEYHVFTEEQLGFGLNGTRGEDVWLIDADEAGRPARFVDYVRFDAAPIGVALGRWPDATGPPTVMDRPTRGQANSGPPDAVALRPGDANGDLRFDQLDLVAILQSAKYRTGGAATWAEGDWNGDGFFDQLDLVDALQTDLYLSGPYPFVAFR